LITRSPIRRGAHYSHQSNILFDHKTRKVLTNKKITRGGVPPIARLLFLTVFD